jgi:hypothetical protein
LCLPTKARPVLASVCNGLKTIFSEIARGCGNCRVRLLEKCPNKHHVFACRAVRTPICKARKGGLKDAYPEDMLSAALRVYVYEYGKLDLICRVF